MHDLPTRLPSPLQTLIAQRGQAQRFAAEQVLFHEGDASNGLYLLLFLQTAEYRAGYVLTGAFVAEILAVGILALVFSRIGKIAQALRPVQVSASLLLVVGMVWFFLRLKS